jgi:protease-4
MRVFPALLTLIILVPFSGPAGQTYTAADTLGPVTPPFLSDISMYRFVADSDDASALFVNPAGLAARRDNSWLFGGTYQFDRLAEISTAAAGRNVGIGYLYDDTGSYKSRAYTLGLGGTLIPGFHVGTSLRWNHTDLPLDDRSPFTVDVGFLNRPHRYISIGGLFRNVNNPRFAGGRLEESFTGGISLRPLTERITLSGQGTFVEGTKPGWFFGGRLSVVPGVELYGTYMRSHAIEISDDPYEEFTAGIAISTGWNGTRYVGRSRIGGEYDYGRYGMLFEGTRSVKESIFAGERFAETTVGGDYLDEGGGVVLMGRSSNDLHALLRELESVRDDPDVRGLLLEIKPLTGSFVGPVSANLYEIRTAVDRIREAGKPVVALLKENATASELYLASAANSIVMPEEGIAGMIGVSLELNRMKRLFGKLGVDWDHYTAGEYKSSFHTTYTDTTTALQVEEIQSLVDESYRLLVEAIAGGRGMSREKALSLADGRMFSAEEAIAEGLVDITGREKEAKEELGRLAGAEKPGKVSTYSVAGRTYWKERWTNAPAVAIVGAYGGIMTGRSKQDIFRGGRTMGSETVVRQLKAAARHPGVRAIVFRVDSGGGSGTASNEILTELRRIQEEEKIPVVVSMGNVAGSGGYWISMYGDAIFVDPFTITGSIGVVFRKPVLERLYEKIGITNEVFKAGEHADAMSPSRSLTEEEMELLGGYIDEMYDYFIGHVAKGRKMDEDEVRRIAGGRVYFGTQALELGLADRIGGLEDAVRYAAKLGGAPDDYRTVYFRAFPGLFWNLDAHNPAARLARSIGSLLGGGGYGFDEMLTLY